MPSSNIFRFSVFNGYFIGVFYYFVSLISWGCIVSWPVNVLILTSHSAIGRPGEFTWTEIGAITAFIILFRVFYIVSKRLILRRLDIGLHEDHIEVTYLPFLFLSRKTIRLSFRDMTVCKVVTANSHFRKNCIKIIMQNGRRYSITSEIRWLKKPADSSNFDVGSIREMYERNTKNI